MPLEGSGRYEHDAEGRMIRKTWKYEIPFVNQNGKPDQVYLAITAAGAGSVEDPLDVYDVTAYAS